MCVKQKANNMAVLGDCGRHPLFIIAVKRCLKYWLKILKMQDHRLVKKCYLMLVHMEELGYTNWVSDIKILLTRNGFGYVWHEQYIANDKLFLHAFTQRLKDQFLQDWSSNISNSPKLMCYSNFKTIFEHENYLSHINIRKFRSALAKLRISNHDLNIERGRYRNIMREDRLCELCREEHYIESEYHFVLVGKSYSVLRTQYIPRKYWLLPAINKFNVLMSTNSETVLKNLAQFVFYAFKLRADLLN